MTILNKIYANNSIVNQVEAMKKIRKSKILQMKD
jgi:hypothetical protein